MVVEGLSHWAGKQQGKAFLISYSSSTVASGRSQVPHRWGVRPMEQKRPLGEVAVLSQENSSIPNTLFCTMALQPWPTSSRVTIGIPGLLSEELATGPHRGIGGRGCRQISRHAQSPSHPPGSRTQTWLAVSCCLVSGR